MAKYTKPDMRERWAEAGNISIPTSDKIEEGWIEEIPPSEVANFIENRQDEALAYLMQQGVAEWENGIEYQTSSFIQYNGDIYKALVVNTGQQPNITPASWRRAFDEFGSAADVQMELDSLLIDPNPFDQYILADDGVATGTHTFEQIDAVSVNVDQGTPTALSPKGLTFGNAKTTGLYQETTTGRVLFQQAGVITGVLPNAATIPSATSDKTLATTEWVKNSLPDATETTKGLVRLATEAETSAGSSQTLAVHPKGVRDLVDAYRLTGDLGTTATLDVPIQRRDTGNASQIQIKYGTVTGASGAVVSYLDGAFDNATRLIVVSHRGASGAVYACSADNETVSGFTLRHSGGGTTITAAYIAIGY